ncbi:MAG TPA: tetratricopeptide repeat protein [Thermoanaerobaculia bacterium]|nr:tetratricopeptide repeat protein [Thermoanaerobaculia bacterium]
MPSDPDAPSRSQSANLSGVAHTNVQIQGDNNVVHIGRSRLDLTLYRGRRRGAVSSPTIEAGEAAEILSPYAMAVPLVGRERELADLRAWMNGDPDLSIRVITAPGGGGKTRLALELCEEAVRRGWHAGFVTDTPLLDSVAANLTRPTLAVVDYAAARLPWLREWLDDLASSPPDGGKLRILLLERYADPNGGWWAEAFQSGGWGDHAVQARLDPADGPYVLPPLRPVEDRRNILEEVFEKAGSDLRLPEEGCGFDRNLAELEWGGEPLFLLMAGLIAAREGFAHVLTLNRCDMAFEVARRHELNRIGRIGESRLRHSRPLVCHMAAYATLCQGLTRDQAEEAVVAEKLALRFDSAGDPPKIYKLLHTALPSAGADVAPILPDIVGEAAILLALGDGDPGKARESVARAAAMTPERVTAVVIRMAQDFGGVDRRPVDWLDSLAERAGDTQALRNLVNQLPDQTLALREIAVRLTAAMVERLRIEDDKARLAGFINNLSNRLSDLGRREEALAAALESVDVYRELSQSRPDAFRPYLATSLNNLSIHLSALGRREEALEAVQASVTIRRELSQSHPDAFRPDLALSLNNLSNYLSELGLGEEALAAVQESVAVYRELAQSRPDAFRPYLAASLNNLSGSLSDLGRREAALEAVQEVVAIRRELSQSRPDAFRPYLASCLYNVAGRLRDLGRFGEALGASEEAVRMLLPFFQAFPAAFLDWMTRMTDLYQELSEENGRQPDPELIAAIDSTFQRIQSTDPGSPS